ncbi:hypothetical protein LPJ61_003049, partial [Coemansia biformis]
MRVDGVLALAMLLAGMAPVLGKSLVIGYYPSWKKQYMDKIDFTKYTHINMAFAIPA